MKTVCIIQARMGSTRLPGKIMQNLGGHPVLEWVIRACRAAAGVDEVIIATSINPLDDIIANHCADRMDVFCVRGSENDVLSRFMDVAIVTKGNIFLRVTGDEPFIDPAVISAVVRLRQETKADYCSNIHPRTYSDGLDVECFTSHALIEADEEAGRAIDRDTVTYFMVRNQHLFSHATVVNPIPGMAKERWVLDTLQDMQFCQEIATRWPWEKGPPSQYDILNILDKEPELRQINSSGIMNERFFEALADEASYIRSYDASNKLLSKTREIIPLGCQTFSKSHVQFPGGKNPLFLSHGKGAYVYDVDGNEYVDLMGALLPNILGMCDPDIDYAIRAQLNQGISFSLATELEYQLAERLVRLIPSAEMVRFGKNGSDATAAGIRLARAYTDRAMVLSSGYHGWPDVFLGPDRLRYRGVPDGVRNLTFPLKHGDSDQAIRLLKSKLYACVIVEPETDPDFLQTLRDVCTETDTILIFDEIITWPRWGLSGAQGHFGVYPDLTCISKALGNGMPISAIMGRSEIMLLMEPPDNIFYSGTFQGEALSIAAAIAVIDKLEKDNVVENLHNKNAVLNGKLLELAKRYDTPISLQIAQGLTRISFHDRKSAKATAEQFAVLFRQTMAAHGTLIINSNNLSFAHGEQEIKRVVKSYEKSFQAIQEAQAEGDIAARTGGAHISDTASVR